VTTGWAAVRRGFPRRNRPISRGTRPAGAQRAPLYRIPFVHKRAIPPGGTVTPEAAGATPRISLPNCSQRRDDDFPDSPGTSPERAFSMSCSHVSSGLPLGRHSPGPRQPVANLADRLDPDGAPSLRKRAPELLSEPGHDHVDRVFGDDVLFLLPHPRGDLVFARGSRIAVRQAVEEVELFLPSRSVDSCSGCRTFW
jgi:hypothetical protein